MPQFTLPFKYEEEAKTSNLTGFAGLPLYLDLLHRLKIKQAMQEALDAGTGEGCVWKPSQIVLTLIMLNLAGGEHVEDLRIFQSDPSISQIMETIAMAGMTNSERRKHKALRKVQGAGFIPSCSTVFRFLKKDNSESLALRGHGRAFIPEPGKTSEQLRAVNKALLGALEHNRPCAAVTLDMDATLIETHKSDSLYSYKGFCAYQPIVASSDNRRNPVRGCAPPSAA